MNEDEERFIRVTIGMLARQLRELTDQVGLLNALVLDDERHTADDHRRIHKDLLELSESVQRVADAFPPELPGSGNGKRLH